MNGKQIPNKDREEAKARIVANTKAIDDAVSTQIKEEEIGLKKLRKHTLYRAWENVRGSVAVS